ncbi:serine/threonine-protein kinase [Kitasatospora sp. NPDC059146]|uniref:serine/threonine-protein kinase n=1 Tax=Kitasatospora sp. NPDC059146 TaxID=3346741 RepID=UPI0036B9A5BD
MSIGVGYVVSGRYRLDRLIGRGGMGRVWGGHDANLDRVVALKELMLPDDLPPEERRELVERAMREARVAARLRHDGVITVHDVITDGGIPWIVMELVRGSSLGEEVRERGAMDWRRVAELGAAMADALAHAHAAGVVHRDLKPENVLLAGDRAVIADFGIARLLDATTQLTRTGVAIGTPHYMSPEQLEGVEAAPASDMWSLGATLYTIVEGRRPFDATTLTALYVSILTQQPAPFRNAGPLADLLGTLLSKDPSLRPDALATADSLRRSLRSPLPGYTPTVVVPTRVDHVPSPNPNPIPSSPPLPPPPNHPPVQGPTSLAALRPLFTCTPEQVVEQAWLQPVRAQGSPALAVCLRGQALGRLWSSVEVHGLMRLSPALPVPGLFGPDEGVVLADGPDTAALTVLQRMPDPSSQGPRQVLVEADLRGQAPVLGRPLDALDAPDGSQPYTTGAAFPHQGIRAIALAGPGVPPFALTGPNRRLRFAGGAHPRQLLSAAEGIVIGWGDGTGRAPAGAVAWDGSNGRVLHAFGGSPVVTGLALSTSGTLACVSGPDAVAVHETATGTELGRLPIATAGGEQSGELALVYDFLRRVVVVHVLDDAIRVWDLNQRQVVAELPGLGERAVAARVMAFGVKPALVVATPRRVGVLNLPGPRFGTTKRP